MRWNSCSKSLALLSPREARFASSRLCGSNCTTSKRRTCAWSWWSKTRCGPASETLSELEALTAADAGDSGGAAVILMGDERLAAFCKDPQLARLDQRSRQRLTVAPLSAAELRGYLMHCFRLAGADFEFIFDNRCAALVHHLSGGIPRIANNIVEASPNGCRVRWHAKGIGCLRCRGRQERTWT